MYSHLRIMKLENRIRDLENDNLQSGNNGVKYGDKYKVKIMKLENRIQDLERENGNLRLEIDFNKVFDEEMERSLNKRISKLHKEKQLLSKELAVKQRTIDNLERRNEEKSTNEPLKESPGFKDPHKMNIRKKQDSHKKNIRKKQMQVQKQRGFNFGTYDPSSSQFNFGWFNEPATNPSYFGRQEEQQFVNNSFNRGFPVGSSFNQTQFYNGPPWGNYGYF